MGFRFARDVPSPLLPAIGVLVVACLLAAPAVALLHIDFEQPHYVHPGMQVWDFCLVRSEGEFHIFYHGIPVATPHPGEADHIWHATSDDLIHWSSPTIVLSVSGSPHESTAVWAPHVVSDPDTGLWWMAYTGVDAAFNQRICMAWSANLTIWHKLAGDPVLTPDPDRFHYDTAAGWAVCRDPFLYREDGGWHMLATAEVLNGTGYSAGAVAHATSADLMSWSAADTFLVNDSATPDRVLESCTYVVHDDLHHLFYLSGSLYGIRHVQTPDPEAWTLTTGALLGVGVAPEVDTFDGGVHHVASRIGQFRDHPDSTAVQCVARFDTLLFDPGAPHPTIRLTPPLDREFAAHEGDICIGNPCLGDNPARRGEPPVGLVGNGYFGSAEFFQGPFGAGAASFGCGEEAVGYLDSHPFVIQGNFISLRIGGSDRPDQVFVALMDAQADTVLRRATADGSDPMVRKWWDVHDLSGRHAYIHIEDSAVDGHLNVDDIAESMNGPMTAAPDTPAAVLTDLGPHPNPFNPGTALRFALTRDATCRARIHDLRGRLVWCSREIRGRAGANLIRWPGIDRDGRRAPGGVYVYRISADPGAGVSGKMTLVP